jgi:nucleoside-diphosphate-sugar epimerase
MKETDYLLTGASGFLGKIIYFSLSNNSSVSSLGRKSINQYCIDLSKNIPHFDESFRTVIHASGKAHSVPKTEKQVQDFFDVNLNGTKNLISGLDQSGKLPAYFVFISTIAVYGEEEGVLITEDNPLQGKTPYARSKIAVEKFLIEWSERNNVILTILRLPLIVAANAPGNLGSMIRFMKRGLYVGIGEGSNRKSMVLADDVALFIPFVKNIGGIYNLTDGDDPTIKMFEFAVLAKVGKRKIIRLPENMIKYLARIGDLLGSRFPLNTYKYKKLTATLTFSDGKARELGWNPRKVINNLPELI